MTAALEPTLLQRFADALGAGSTEAGGILRPRSSDQVITLCQLCSETGTRFAVRSGTAEPHPQGLSVTVQALHDVRVHRGAMVAFAGAGAYISHMREVVEQAGLSLAVPLPEGVTHVGSAIGRGLLPRRAFTGIAAVLPSGERVATQGHVLKDVSGYDLAGALLGSAGRLAVITAAYFRLVPQGVSLPHADPPGMMTGDGTASALLRQAFDPMGLLLPLGDG